MSARLARLLNVQGVPHAFAFSLVQGLLIFSLALPVTVTPLLALKLLGDDQSVSLFYLEVSVAGLIGALVFPKLLERFGRVRMLLAGLACVAASAVLFPLATTPSLYGATVLYTYGFFAVDLIVNIVVMERVPRHSFMRFEALRMAFLGVGFAGGPWLGVVLAEDFGLAAPFVLMAATAAAACLYCLARGFVNDARGSIPGHGNPLRFVPRFVAQPRLLVAYALALTRSAWWTTFFIYAPIYCVAHGYTDEDAGVVVSLAALFVILAPLWGRLGAPLGMRGHLIAGYVATGLVAFVMAALADTPFVGVVLLLLACLCAGWLDAVGNAPFARAIRPRERAEMTSLYTTYREFGRILPQGVFALVLLAFPLEAVFACAGAGMLVGAWYARYIPRRY